jgi:hypothetical protein
LGEAMELASERGGFKIDLWAMFRWREPNDLIDV